MNYKKIMDSLFKENFELEKQRDQFKAERDTLIDDLTWYKAKVNRLERELSAALKGELATYDELQKYVLELQNELKESQKQIEKLNRVANEAMDIAESENLKARAWDRLYDMILDEDMTVREFDDEMYELLKQTGKTDIRIITDPCIRMEDK